MNSKVIIRPQAALDLYDQAIYLGQHATQDIADRFLHNAQETFKMISKHPQIGVQSKLLTPSLSHTRMFRIQQFPKHLVFYFSHDKRVEIVRIVHSSRDLEHLYK